MRKRIISAVVGISAIIAVILLSLRISICIDIFVACACTLSVFEFVKAHEDENVTAKDIATALELDPRKVNGIITAAFQRHREEVDGEKVIVPLMERVEGELEIETEDGKLKHETVKFIKLTEAGRAFVPEVE